MNRLSALLVTSAVIAGAPSFAQTSQLWRFDQRDLQVERNRNRTILRAASKGAVAGPGVFAYGKGVQIGSHSHTGDMYGMTLVAGPHLGKGSHTDAGPRDFGQSIGLSADYINFDSDTPKEWLLHADYQLTSDARDVVSVVNVNYLAPEQGNKIWAPSLAFAAAAGNTVLTVTPGYELESRHLQVLTGEVNVQYNLSNEVALYGFYTSPNGVDAYSDGFGVDWVFASGARSLSVVAEAETNKTYLAGVKVRF